MLEKVEFMNVAASVRNSKRAISGVALAALRVGPRMALPRPGGPMAGV
jgi:hypothetical protein